MVKTWLGWRCRGAEGHDQWRWSHEAAGQQGGEAGPGAWLLRVLRGRSKSLHLEGRVFESTPDWFLGFGPTRQARSMVLSMVLNYHCFFRSAVLIGWGAILCDLHAVVCALASQRPGLYLTHGIFTPMLHRKCADHIPDWVHFVQLKNYSRSSRISFGPFIWDVPWLP